MRIGIIGAGMVGGTLGRKFAEAGHEIVFGLRNPAKPEYVALVKSIGENACAATSAEVATACEIIVLATPWPATKTAIETLGTVEGKIIIDATNPLEPDLSGLTMGHNFSGGEQIQKWARGARVVKAFNSTGFANMAAPDFGDRKAVMFYAGDDDDARETVRSLIQDVGFEAVDAGPLAVARELESLALLWIRLAHVQGLGRDFAFVLARRE